ncbi:MAG: sigma-54 dependent transcriptional regulator [Thermodesulfobacteriota bacterium]
MNEYIIEIELNSKNFKGRFFTMANVLIVDDDPVICRIMSRAIAEMNHHVSAVHTLAEGLAESQKTDFDIVLLDVCMPDGNGMEFVPLIMQTPSQPEVIIITALGSSGGAEIAIKNGAWDYLQKPVSKQDLALALRQAHLYRKSRQQAALERPTLKRHGIIGDSPRIRECRDALAQAAQSKASVLICGETGTGKELFAQAIHSNSPRAKKNFVVVDCAALPANLIESALFGHERGAFTGANRAQVGLVKQADGGTLFLDEIGELPLSLQKNFLRVLQEHCFRPIGSDQEQESDFRLVAATHRNLDRMVSDGLFRQDLMYRLRSISIELPALRERQEDIANLAQKKADKICHENGIPPKSFANDALEALHAYGWPGNVRELINTLEATINKAFNEQVLFARHLPQQLRIQIKKEQLDDLPAGQMQESQVKGAVPASPLGPMPSFRQHREAIVLEAEKEYLENLLTLTNGSRKEACRIADLGRTRLYNLLKKHGLGRSPF